MKKINKNNKNKRGERENWKIRLKKEIIKKII